MLNEDELRTFDELLEKATPRPWKRDRNWSITGPQHDWERTWPPAAHLIEEAGGDPLKIELHDQRIAFAMHGPVRHTETSNRPIPDGDLIIAMVNNAEFFITEIRTLRACIERLEYENEELRGSAEIREKTNEEVSVLDEHTRKGDKSYIKFLEADAEASTKKVRDLEWELCEERKKRQG